VARHVVWAVAFVAAVLIVGYFFGPRRTEVPRPQVFAGTPVPVNTYPPAPPLVLAPPQVTVPSSGVDYGFWAQFLHYLAHQPTRPAIVVVTQTPLPREQPTPPPGLTPEQARYIHDLAVQADEEAIREVGVQVRVIQEPVAPSRFSSVAAVDHGVGMGYALSRRGPLELDGDLLLHNQRLIPGASIIYDVPRSGVGVGPGAVYEDGRVSPALFLEVHL
jgi:hypothetical protein